jgi:hypothetical protein
LLAHLFRLCIALPASTTTTTTVSTRHQVVVPISSSISSSSSSSGGCARRQCCHCCRQRHELLDALVQLLEGDQLGPCLRQPQPRQQPRQVLQLQGRA